MTTKTKVCLQNHTKIDTEVYLWKSYHHRDSFCTFFSESLDKTSQTFL